ncbi:MAG: hypothetical protein HC848_07315 [Limnobacter sp.]|nr:hypothetical protein [Limnobacter sp.]
MKLFLFLIMFTGLTACVAEENPSQADPFLLKSLEDFMAQTPYSALVQQTQVRIQPIVEKNANNGFLERCI